MKTERIERVLSRLKGMGLEQMLITDPRSIYYLTDVYVAPFERFFAFYINANGKHVMFLNKLFAIPDGVEVEKVWLSDTDSVTDALLKVIDKDKKLGVDKDIKARFLLPLMENNAAAGFTNSSYAVDITRGVKDEKEQELMRISSDINDKAMAKFKGLIHEGVTEKQVADQMHQIYLDLGADDYSFTPIVSFGANAADPHHEPDDTVLKEGDCVLFDVGGIKDGYCSDMTRTFYYKSVSDHCREVYNLVRSANEAAEALIKPGVALADLDAAARNLITKHGYGPNFNHRLGHFIGLDEHEFGDVSSSNDWKAEPGMIFSIEPGVYIEGDTGVRVEDLVLVTEDGVEVLNHYSHELEIIE
ncbi:MAG: Xaa-Pro peptidase family protein [Lachnospiraceae bacterium]|nr:Xaa-Pro peptidase family protein [Lachnospiraceae bacterium]